VLDIGVDEETFMLDPDQQRLVMFARSFHRKARLLIADEPTAGLCEYESRTVLYALKRLNATGMTILFVSHYLTDVAELCDRVTVLRYGQDRGPNEWEFAAPSWRMKQHVLLRASPTYGIGARAAAAHRAALVGMEPPSGANVDCATTRDGYRPLTCSRSVAFFTLPVGVTGNPSKSSTCLGAVDLRRILAMSASIRAPNEGRTPNRRSTSSALDLLIASQR
jgi:ABC-type glutathione transport system ATPase component